MPKKDLPVSPKNQDEAGAWPVVRISADGLIHVRVDREERIFRLATVEENGDVRIVATAP